jgi:DNA adenine methylase
MDPPYVPFSETANFTGYTAGGFGDTDQVRLASVFRKLVTRGCHVLLSNSDTPRSRELYRNFRIVELQRSGRISCKPNGRDAVGEILVIGT